MTMTFEDAAFGRAAEIQVPKLEACDRCDFRPVCGPDVFRRVARKPQDQVLDLAELRRRP